MRSLIATQDVRSLFFSDVHLGSGYCQPLALRGLVEALNPEKIYILGDFCDGWLLRRRWQWSCDYSILVDSLHRKQSAGCEVYYLLGNHDRCLQRWIMDWGDFWVGEKLVHRCANGRDLLLIHGDQFDSSQNRLRRAASVSAVVHEQMLGGGRIVNRLLAEFGVSNRKLATTLSIPIKTLTHSISQFRHRARQLATQYGCDGIVFGHTHTPAIREVSNFLFANTGDWLEHCSVIVERYSGQLELWMGAADKWMETARRFGLSPAGEATSL